METKESLKLSQLLAPKLSFASEKETAQVIEKAKIKEKFISADKIRAQEILASIKMQLGLQVDRVESVSCRNKND